MKFIVFGSALLIMFTAAAAIAPRVFFFLPLGGSPVAEMGIVLGLAAAAATTLEIFRKNDP